MIQAVVGAGGKTSLVKRYAREYLAQGKTVLVTTSTHMLAEADALLTDDAETIIRALETRGYVMAGRPAESGNSLDQHMETSERDRKTGTVIQKMGALSDATYREVCRHADVVLIEADGSKHMPIKFPNECEPVIYDNVDEVIVVCGLHALGRPMREVAHRPELVSRCLGIADDTIIRPEHIQQLVREGYLEPLRKRYPDKKITVEPNANDTLYQRVLASMMKADLDVSLVREEWFRTQPNLVICGGGHVSCELVKMASCLDFKIKVMDDREDFANRERFPLADEVICDSFDRLEQYLEPDAYYCVVTRGHKDDFTCVKTILAHPYEYLGMIGSRTKVKTTFDRLRADGVSEEQIGTIFAPIGLPIRAVTPAEIAVSILAQIIQEKNAKQVSSVSRELLEVREHGVLCIIIEKTGSSPRGVGSMMFVGEHRTIDSIGGGAVEFAAFDEAKTCTEAMVKEYYLNPENGADLGMVCGGSNRVLFVPV